MKPRLLRGDFGVVLPQLAANGVQADAILLDLGVSSMQLDRPERGFSYSVDAPLDMRMDSSQELTRARDRQRVARSASSRRSSAATAKSATRSRSSARSCAGARSSRSSAPASSSTRSRAAIPAPARFGEGHPAKRVFQALRIAVNDELGVARGRAAGGARDAAARRSPRGDLFHSLEDRIVKHFLREKERGCTCPPDFPVCVCGHEPELRAIERRPVRPGQAEVAANPRLGLGAPARRDQGRRRE